MSAAFGVWLRRQREARGWSRSELARRMTDAAGSAVTAPAHVLETYLSRWEAGHVTISARYRQLLDAVLGPGTSGPAVSPVSVPPGPRKWVRAMRAIESGIADGQWKPGDRLPARPALAQRSSLSVNAVMRAQGELLSVGVLRRGPVHGALYVSDAQDQQPLGTPLPAAPGLAGRGGGRAASPPPRAGDAPSPARNPRAYARPDTRVPAVPAVPADAGTEPGQAPARSPADPGELPPADGLPEFMLVRECAAQIRVSPPAIHGLIKQGQIEAVRVGRDFRICTRSWLAYLHAPRPGPRPQPQPEGEGDGQRDHPPQTGSPPAQPQPQPAGGAGPGAPPVIFRAPG